MDRWKARLCHRRNSGDLSTVLFSDRVLLSGLSVFRRGAGVLPQALWPFFAYVQIEDEMIDTIACVILWAGVAFYVALLVGYLVSDQH